MANIKDFLASNAGNLSYLAIQAANASLGTSLPASRISQQYIDHFRKITLPYVKARIGQVRNTINNFRNRPRRLEPEPSPMTEQEKKVLEGARQRDLERQKLSPKQTQRELYRRQQKARIGQPLPERPVSAEKEFASAQSSAGTDEGAVSRSPAAIMARLRAAQAQDMLSKKEALVRALPGGETVEKIQELQRAIKRLQNIYRIINGAASVTVWGLILAFLIMNAQLIGGNLLKIRLIPKLHLIEIGAIGVVDLLLLFIIFLIIILIVFMVDPGGAICGGFVEGHVIRSICGIIGR